jgi:hypothetical protein
VGGLVLVPLVLVREEEAKAAGRGRLGPATATLGAERVEAQRPRGRLSDGAGAYWATPAAAESIGRATGMACIVASIADGREGEERELGGALVGLGLGTARYDSCFLRCGWARVGQTARCRPRTRRGWTMDARSHARRSRPFRRAAHGRACWAIGLRPCLTARVDAPQVV